MSSKARKRDRKRGGKGKGKKSGGRKQKPSAAQIAEEAADARKKEAQKLINTIDPFVTQATVNKDVIIENYSMSSPDGATQLLQKVNLKFSYGRRYGLVGKNGSGKTTLLRNISSYAIEDFPLHVRMVHVAQEHVKDEYTILDAVLNSDSVRVKLLAEQERLEEEQAIEEDEEKGDEIATLLDAINQHIEELDINASEEKASRILKGLGFHEVTKTKTAALSGGWRMRVELAKALFINPDLMLLDEPTNHLDFPAVLWLQEYLINEFENTLILVSHDRTFLNAVSTNVIHLEEEYKRLDYYKGNYDSFEKTRAENLVAQQKVWNANNIRITQIEEYLEKTQHQGAERQAQRKSKEKELKKLKAEQVEEVKEEKKFQMRFPEVSKDDLGAQHIVTCEDVEFGYTPERKILENINLRIDMDSRVGIIGANGVGKSTLIKIMMGRLEPQSGHVDRNRQARIAYFTQHHYDQLDLNMSPVSYLLEKFKTDLEEDRDRVQTVRRFLGRFRIKNELQNMQMKFLSGGQKSRVAFAVLTFRTPHLIIMDEPTNHLDLETVDAVIESIVDYEGGIVVISHDQHFLKSCCEQFWSVTPEKIRRYKEFENAKNFALKKRIDEIHYY